ncbi:hypothetical protein CHS0354_039174 [Potamilus streckersoni]|uniref:Sugar phosphate transporter domain-containing protein n=1 Tax=Potamilus streckersoni TaxID=2493646 RepID=A0AAE0S792_9BIVA|nr:hypothetical protein CHS0354_039174 [Potamilus streckersoni]
MMKYRTSSLLDKSRRKNPKVRFNIEDLSSKVKGTGAAILYGTCSVSMAFINKILMTSLEFDFPVLIMVFQMLFTISVLKILCYFSVINMPRYTLSRGLSFAMPSIFYATNSVLALGALSHMNFAVYGVLKRCVPFVTLLLSILILRKGCSSKMTILSVCMLTIGCVLTGLGDLEFNAKAYIFGGLSNISQSLYLLLIQRSAHGKMSTIETLQLNSINTLPFLTVAMISMGEVEKAMSYTKYNEISFIVAFLVTISLGCLLNYSLFLCTRLTSALTTSVVGGLKALAQTFFALFTFGGISHNMSTYIGISMNTFGGIFYIYVKYKESFDKKSTDLKKIMSFSTAEDFKSATKEDEKEEEEHMENGFVVVTESKKEES